MKVGFLLIGFLSGVATLATAIVIHNACQGDSFTQQTVIPVGAL